MDNLTQLFVRACKSGNPEQRIYSVYKRFYNRLEMSDQRKAAVLTDILSSIVDECCPIRTNKLINEINNYWYKDMDLQDRMLLIMINQIRFEITTKTHTMRTPRKFKAV